MKAIKQGHRVESLELGQGWKVTKSGGQDWTP